MDVAGERILLFGDSLSHHGQDSAAEIWDVDADSNRASSAPGDLLASMLLEQGAQAVRIDANVGRSAHNFWAGNARYQFNSANDLIESDRAFAPTKVIVMLGTNDADSGAIDAAAMQAIKDAYEGMGAEVWAIGPPTFVNDGLNLKADQAFTMMSGVFGGRLIDARPLSSTDDRAGDGVHFHPGSAQALANNLANAIITTKTPKRWLGIVLGVGAVGFLSYVLWRKFSSTMLAGPEHIEMNLVDGKKWTRGHSPRAAGYKEIACKSSLPGLRCWASRAKLGDAKLDAQMARQSLKEENEAIDVYGERLKKAESKALKKAIKHARKEEREHAASFKKLLR